MPARRKKIQLSSLYSFACGKKSFEFELSHIGSTGYSRVVYVNFPENHEEGSRYTSNAVSTTKYTLINFVPKSLFEQFRRVANFYFLLTGLLAFTPLAPYTAVSAILPLCIVIMATMAKEGIEDWRRKQQDHEVNNRKVKIHRQGGEFVDIQWRSLRVGDIVKVDKDNYFPADLLLLSSNYPDNICYVETMNLDGETNLKLKQAVEVPLGMKEDDDFQDFTAIIKCEDPNANLYSFIGAMEFRGQQYPLTPQQLLLRDSKLRNTDYIYGAVIFTGHDTKVMQNATNPPSKRSKIEQKMDKIIYFLMFCLLVISLIGSIFFGIWTKNDLNNGKIKRWYLRPDNATVFFDPRRVALASFFHLLTTMMLYNYFIPISLYVSIEIVKILQALFINQDIHMYHEESGKPTRARTSNLNEELGMVDTILSDKTGTLTSNVMEFIKCTIGGVSYGHGVTEIEKAMAKRMGKSIDVPILDAETGERGYHVKGFNFNDLRIMKGRWIDEPNKDVIRDFLRLLSVCHTCIPEVDEQSNKITYEAESPDEAAFVIAARELGFEFYQRTQNSLTVREVDPLTGISISRTYKLLNVLEFTSARKRMSVIVRDPDGIILLFSKGADSVMFKRLGENGRQFEEETKRDINQYADAGLRTLVLAYRELDEEEYNEFNKKFTAAKASVSADRDDKIEEAADRIERNLILLGATAVEDKLQNGVPECIDKLAQAGIKIWVLTGDKMETAINIGFACSLLRQGMTQITITLEEPHIIALEKNGNKDEIIEASRASVLQQIENGIQQVTHSRQWSGNSQNQPSFALIIDGKSLTYALEEGLKLAFLHLAVSCVSVICCRSSPKQKALVTRLVKMGTRQVCLAIGDGANDVGMLQEADIGVGISGAEGMQAVMASDFAIPQFQFLERLLLVHGHWCYRRISIMICYFFYKNVTFGVTLFLFEAHASFSGQPAYNDWFLSLFNVVFTSLPVITLGVFDQDVSARHCLQYPFLYQEGVKNALFSWTKILGWMFNGIVDAIIIFFCCTSAFHLQAFRSSGQVASFDILGSFMYTCVVWVVNCQILLSTSYFTVIQHIVIWGSIAVWYLFLVAYGDVTPLFSTTAYMVFVERLAPAPAYWVLTFLVVITTLIPFFSYAAIQSWIFPMDHNVIQHRLKKKGTDEQFRRLPSRSGVGLTARLEQKVEIPVHQAL